MSDLPPPDGSRPTDPTTSMPATPPAHGAGPPPGPPGARPAGPPPQPSGSGISVGIVVVLAGLLAVIGFLAGALIFGGDDGDDTTETATTTSVVGDDTTPTDGSEDLTAAIAALTVERDQLASQVDDLTAQLESVDGDTTELRDQVDQLQTDLDAVSAERDDLQAQLDAIGGEVVPAPDLVDGTVDDARDAADEAGWELVERDATDVPADTAPGTVVAQSPEPETAMVEGSVLIVEVAPEPAEG